MRFPVPHVIASVAKEAKRAFPYSVALSESLHSFKQSQEKLEHYGDDLSLLVSSYTTDVYTAIEKGSVQKIMILKLTFDFRHDYSLGNHSPSIYGR